MIPVAQGGPSLPYGGGTAYVFDTGLNQWINQWGNGAMDSKHNGTVAYPAWIPSKLRVCFKQFSLVLRCFFLPLTPPFAPPEQQRYSSTTQSN